MFHTKVKSLHKGFFGQFFLLHKPGQKKDFFQKGFQCAFADGFPMVFPHFFRFVRVPVVVIVAVAVVVLELVSISLCSEVVVVCVVVVVVVVVVSGGLPP